MRWTLKPKPNPEKIKQLCKALQVDEVVSTLLLQRGIETYEQAKQFFRPSLNDLHNPFLMKGMDKAVARIEQAINANETILVYGDYDVDGTTAVSLMSSYLLESYKNVSTYIPDRYDEGYGVSYKSIDYADDNGITLIIALDCGIKAVDKVEYAQKKGIDYIICDHHRPGETIPNAVAILNPKQLDCEYPYKELCGCGVGFKLIQALNAKKKQPINAILPYLDLVATAIGADIVPITGENRTLCYYGLEVINSKPRVGFQSFINQFDKRKLTVTDLVFGIAPRINAAGRMKHGQYAVNLLTEANSNAAQEFAKEIEDFNTNRKDADKRITKEALQQIEDQKEQNRTTTVVYSENWHKGVIGIVASRLIETYYRPTLVFTKSADKLAASARSVKGFDVYNALESCSEYIEQFGGHKYAAGLTLKPENYERFKQKFEEVVSETIPKHLLTPEITIDAPIEFTQITDKLHRIINQFAPFGPGNMTPVFMTENLKDTGYGKCVGKDQSHLRLTATKQHKNIVAIGFGLGNKLAVVSNKKAFKAVYTIDENCWNGNVSLQLKLKDIM